MYGCSEGNGGRCGCGSVGARGGGYMGGSDSIGFRVQGVGCVEGGGGGGDDGGDGDGG